MLITLSVSLYIHKTLFMLWSNRYSICVKYHGFTHLRWVLPLAKASCCVECCALIFNFVP
jgi:hypothetical protein